MFAAFSAVPSVVRHGDRVFRYTRLPWSTLITTTMIAGT
jgi:hypothetical protein